MKSKIFPALLAIFVVFCFSTGTAMAEKRNAEVKVKKIPVLENGTLTMTHQVTTIKRTVTEMATGVPKELSVEQALRAVGGETIEIQKVTGSESVLSFPIITRTYTETLRFSYNNGLKVWNKVPTSNIERRKSWGSTILAIFMPLLGIMVINIASILTNSGKEKLFAFNVCILAAMTVGIMASILADTLTGVLFGAAIGSFIGAFAGQKIIASIGIIAGFFAGMFAGMCSGVLTGGQGLMIGLQYTAIIACMMVASYVVALIVKTIRDWIATKKEKVAGTLA